MRYKVGEKVRVRKDLKCETYIGKVFFNPEMKEFFGEVLTIEYVYYDRYAVTENNWYWSDKMLEPVTNRSKVGKKAYRTFIKNGGSRNSKGQFSKKQKIDWKVLGLELEHTFWNTNALMYERKMVNALIKVFQKHGLISKEVEI